MSVGRHLQYIYETSGKKLFQLVLRNQMLSLFLLFLFTVVDLKNKHFPIFLQFPWWKVISQRLSCIFISNHCPSAKTECLLPPVGTFLDWSFELCCSGFPNQLWRIFKEKCIPREHSLKVGTSEPLFFSSQSHLKCWSLSSVPFDLLSHSSHH